MKKLKLIKVVVSSLIVSSIMLLNPMGASAEWKQDSIGWWYAEGSSWSTGWKLIDGNWYYFYSNGYMAHNTTIENCKLGFDGAWITAESNAVLSDYEYVKKLQNLSVRLDAWETKNSSEFKKLSQDGSYALSNTFKQKLVGMKSEIHEIYKEACTFNPSSKYRALNDSLVSYIKSLDEGLTLFGEAIEEKNMTKLNKSVEMMKKAETEQNKIKQILNGMK